MSPKALMVHVDDTKTCADRIELACRLAERFEAMVIGIAAAAPEPPMADPFAVGAMVGEMAMLERSRAEEQLNTARTLFESVTSRFKVGAEWRAGIGYPGDLVATEMRAADLVIVGRDTGQSAPNHALSAGDVLMRSGRPVLIVPPGVDAAPAERILIAWKDSREAQRAVVDALPFLQQASSVSILSVHRAGEEAHAKDVIFDLAAFLARHGVKAETFLRAESPLTDADEILAFAHQQRVDLLVMGGYGRARLREWAFGGVTHDVLARSGVCALISH